VTLLDEMYQDYRLELLRLRGDAEGRLAFEPYDRPPEPVDPSSTFRPVALPAT
jgi:hypothetical protein